MLLFHKVFKYQMQICIINLYRQSKSPGSSIIPLHSDTPSMESVKVYKDPGTYNVTAIIISTLVSFC